MRPLRLGIAGALAYLLYADPANAISSDSWPPDPYRHISGPRLVSIGQRLVAEEYRMTFPEDRELRYIAEDLSDFTRRDIATNDIAKQTGIKKGQKVPAGTEIRYRVYRDIQEVHEENTQASVRGGVCC